MRDEAPAASSTTPNTKPGPVDPAFGLLVFCMQVRRSRMGLAHTAGAPKATGRLGASTFAERWRWVERFTRFTRFTGKSSNRVSRPRFRHRHRWEIPMHRRFPGPQRLGALLDILGQD